MIFPRTRSQIRQMVTGKPLHRIIRQELGPAGSRVYSESRWGSYLSTYESCYAPCHIVHGGIQFSLPH